LKQISKLLATLFYAGYFPIAPGTVGSLFALVIYLIIPKTVIQLPYFWLFPVVLVLPSVLVTGEAEKLMQRDDKRIVLDEFTGFFFAVIFLPKSILVGFTAFIFFRIFDILKPPPVNTIQRWKGGWGIVFDDVMAGIYANLLTQIVYFTLLLTG
jgi:phosphatidylglycerophosphatase A